ncbi:hypothetical protein [Sphingomonas sp. MMS24-J13]|uniref:hypothetical protein n=1 Tax=Sphingomonas sp. MMS24-J13 TaxID=3238686 RepID=UPI00384B7609
MLQLAMFLGLFLSLACCATGKADEPVPAARQYRTYVIKPEDVKSVVKVRTKLFHEYLLNSAIASGQSLPEYNKWLSAVTSAVRSGSAPPSRESPLTINAQLELKPFLKPMPQTRDLEALGAIREQTELGKLGGILVDGFKDQATAIRAAGASAIADDIGTP